MELYFDEEQQRLFDVQIYANGQMSKVLTNFDIYEETGELPHISVLMSKTKINNYLSHPDANGPISRVSP